MIDSSELERHTGNIEQAAPAVIDLQAMQVSVHVPSLLTQTCKGGHLAPSSMTWAALTLDTGDAAQAEQEVQGAAGEQGTRVQCGLGTDPEEAFRLEQRGCWWRGARGQLQQLQRG